MPSPKRKPDRFLITMSDGSFVTGFVMNDKPGKAHHRVRDYGVFMTTSKPGMIRLGEGYRVEALEHEGYLSSETADELRQLLDYAKRVGPLPADPL